MNISKERKQWLILKYGGPSGVGDEYEQKIVWLLNLPTEALTHMGLTYTIQTQQSEQLFVKIIKIKTLNIDEIFNLLDEYDNTTQ